MKEGGAEDDGDVKHCLRGALIRGGFRMCCFAGRPCWYTCVFVKFACPWPSQVFHLLSRNVIES